MKTEQQNKITTPEWIEVIESGEIVFRRAKLATVAEIELDLIRTVAELRVIDSDDRCKSEDAYSRVCSLSELRNQRLGRDDGWLKALVEVLLKFEAAAETDTSPCSTASTSSGDPLS